MRVSNLFRYSASILNEITYKSGSIIFLDDKDLDKFETLVDSVNRNIEFFNEENLRKLKNIYLDDLEEFKKHLSEYCKEEYKEILDNAVYFEETYKDKIKGSKLGVKDVIKYLYNSSSS